MLQPQELVVFLQLPKEGNMFSNVNDNIVVIDDLYSHRWHDAFGLGVKKYLPSAGIPTDDTTGEMNSWVATETGTNTTVNSITANSLFLMTTGATEYNGYSSQVKGTTFAATSNKPFYFGGKFTISDATQTDFLFGLCGTDTTLTAASAAHAVAVSAGGFFFSKIDGSTAITFNVYTTSVATSSMAVGTMTTGAHTYECYFDGEYMNVYFDSALVGRTNASIPASVCTPSISFRAGEAAAKTLECGWLKAIQAY